MGNALGAGALSADFVPFTCDVAGLLSADADVEAGDEDLIAEAGVEFRTAAASLTGAGWPGASFEGFDTATEL